MDIEERIKMAFNDLDYFSDVIYCDVENRTQRISIYKKIYGIKNLIKELKKGGI